MCIYKGDLSCMSIKLLFRIRITLLALLPSLTYYQRITLISNVREYTTMVTIMELIFFVDITRSTGSGLLLRQTLPRSIASTRGSRKRFYDYVYFFMDCSYMLGLFK